MTPSTLAKLKEKGLIRDFAYKVPEKGKKRPAGANTLKSNPTGLAHIKWVLQKRGIVYHEEYVFSSTRKFRFDVALLQYRIGIEYEGLVATGKKGGHQTKSGFTSNCTKYNLASLEGWRLLRYTSKNYKDFETDLTTYLTIK